MIKTNILPVPTWNKFKINYKEIPDLVDDYHPCFPKISNLSPCIYINNQKNLDDVFDNFLPEDEAVRDLTNKSSLYRSINIENNSILKEPIILDFSFIDKTTQSETFDITIGTNSKATIIFVFDTLSPDFSGSHMSLFRVNCLKNSHLEIKTLNLLSQSFLHYENILANLDDNASFSLHQMVLGGKTTVNGAHIHLNGQDCKSEIKNNYIGRNEQDLDFNYVSSHIGKKSHSETNLNGILLKNSKKITRATIDFIKGCKKSIGNENEHVLLLDKEIINKSIPLILCGEDDIVGNHGTTIGSIDNEILFYLKSRGLDEERANRLFLEANINQCKSSLPEEFTQRIDQHCEDLLL